MKVTKEDWQMLPIGKLHLAKWNYKKEDGKKAEEAKKKLKKALEKRGVSLNLIVRNHPSIEGEYEVINGNHRLEVLLESGEHDEVMCCNYGDISLHLAQMIARETNKEYFVADPDKERDVLANILKHVDMDEMFETINEERTKVESFLRGPQIKEKELDELETKHECPSCGYKW